MSISEVAYSKPMGYNVREVRKALIIKLRAIENRSAKHPRYDIYDDAGMFLGATHISHGARDINDNLLTLMARQLKVRTSDFRAIIICELEREDYIRLSSH